MPKNCFNRKNEIRIHEILPNGQHFNLYFIRIKAKPADRINFLWKVGLCISSSRKEANLWWSNKNRKFDNKSTGKCGLVGLSKALEYVISFSKKLKFNEELDIEWSDEKRKKAYRYLLKYGFHECERCYTIRNLKYWEMEEE